MGQLKSKSRKGKVSISVRDDTLVKELKPATTMPMVKLVYFAAEGRGELTRILLNIGNIDFEDFRFGFDEWPKHKPNTPFGSVRSLSHCEIKKLGKIFKSDRCQFSSGMGKSSPRRWPSLSLWPGRWGWLGNLTWSLPRPTW